VSEHVTPTAAHSPLPLSAPLSPISVAAGHRRYDHGTPLNFRSVSIVEYFFLLTHIVTSFI